MTKQLLDNINNIIKEVIKGKEFECILDIVREIDAVYGINDIMKSEDY